MADTSAGDDVSDGQYMLVAHVSLPAAVVSKWGPPAGEGAPLHPAVAAALDEAKRAEQARLSSGSVEEAPVSSSMAAFVREVVAHVVHGSILASPQAVGVLQHAVAPDAGAEPAAAQAWRTAVERTIVSTIWGAAMEVELAEHRHGDAAHDSTAWGKLAGLVKALASRLISADVLRESLSADLLQSAGLLNGAHWGGVKGFLKRTVKANTRLLYTQVKFNLLREETEGYAKLVTELTRPRPRHDPSAATLRNVQSLVGYFRLDPNRVFAMVLEAMESRPTDATLMSLAKQFRLGNIPHVLGVKFQMHANMKSTPSSLFDVAALLVAEGVLAPSELLPHLDAPLAGAATADGAGPTSLSTVFSSAVEATTAAAEDFFIVKLGGASSGPVGESKRDDSDPAPSHTEANGTWRQASGIAGAALESAAKASQWQVLQLVAALLRRRAWAGASAVIQQITTSGVEPAAFEVVGAALCQLVLELVGPACKRHGVAGAALFATRGNGSGAGAASAAPASAVAATPQVDGPPMHASTAGVLQPANDVGEALVMVQPMLDALGPHLSNHPVLFTRLCRLLAYAWTCDSAMPQHKLRVVVYGCVKRHILSAMPLLGSRPQVANEVWAILSHLSWTQRYALYNQWLSSTYESHYQLKLARGRVSGLLHVLVLGWRREPTHSALPMQASFATRQAVKRIAKETVKSTGRLLAKAAHSNPLVVFDTLIQRLEVFDNLIPVTVDSLRCVVRLLTSQYGIPLNRCVRYMTAMALDCCLFIVVYRLALSRPRSLDGSNVEKWLSSLSSFAGLFMRKYHTTDCRGLIQFTLNAAATRATFDLLVLQELLAHMGGVESVEDMSDDQILGQAGGPVLRATSAITADANTSSARRARAALKAVLTEVAYSSLLLHRVPAHASFITRQGTAARKLALPLLILLSQQPNRVLYDGPNDGTDKTHFKVGLRREYSSHGCSFSPVTLWGHIFAGCGRDL